MEARSGAHHWAPQVQSFGHSARLIRAAVREALREERRERRGRRGGDLRGAHNRCTTLTMEEKGRRSNMISRGTSHDQTHELAPNTCKHLCSTRDFNR